MHMLIAHISLRHPLYWVTCHQYRSNMDIYIITVSSIPSCGKSWHVAQLQVLARCRSPSHVKYGSLWLGTRLAALCILVGWREGQRPRGCRLGPFVSATHRKSRVLPKATHRSLDLAAPLHRILVRNQRSSSSTII